ncbi:MAG: hypothetical protein FWF50_05495 [Defluviitaleaceae bacterium]|nr:hypothetical protein [Defluviitaleaceae bacterium]
MLKTLEQTIELINEGKLLQIAGAKELLRKLPKGNWIGGTQEYFVTDDFGGETSNEKLFVAQFSLDEVKNYKIKEYDEKSIKNMPKDSYSNGFSIVILPVGSPVFLEYARNAVDYEDIFFKNIVGWGAGYNLAGTDTTALVINGQTGNILEKEAIVLHMERDENINISILNIFEPDENSPVITFKEETTNIKNAFINGEEVEFVKYLKENEINIMLPMIGDYSGQSINVPFNPGQNLDAETIALGAPAFPLIEYRFAKPIKSYEEAFANKSKELHRKDIIFSVNCALNYLYGSLEGKKVENLNGPAAFGEIAYKLLTQTVVFVERI